MYKPLERPIVNEKSTMDNNNNNTILKDILFCSISKINNDEFIIYFNEEEKSIKANKYQLVELINQISMILLIEETK